MCVCVLQIQNGGLWWIESGSDSGHSRRRSGYGDGGKVEPPSSAKNDDEGEAAKWESGFDRRGSGTIDLVSGRRRKWVGCWDDEMKIML